MSQPVSPAIIKVKELIALLEPYALNWQSWIKSEDCFFDHKEVRIIQNYLLTGSHIVSCVEFGITEIEATEILCSVKRRLCLDYPKFEQWLSKQAFS